MADLVRVGQTVGHLYIARTGVTWHGKTAVEVIRLRCLRRTRVRVEHLASGAVTSCGCVRRQQLARWAAARVEEAG